MSTIFGNFIYLMAFYFLVLLPFCSLVLLRAFRAFQRKISGLEGGWIKSLFYSYLMWCILSLFAASLAYLQITLKTGSYYFLIHFFLVVPVLSLLLGMLFSKIKNKDCTKDFSTNVGTVLNFFSFFIAFIYMGLKSHLGM